MEKRKKSNIHDVNKVRKEPRHQEDMNEKEPHKGSDSHDDKHQHIERERK